MPCTSGKGFGFIIIGKSLIIIVVVGSLRLGGPGVYKISQSLRFLRNGTEYWGLFPFVHNGPAFMRFLESPRADGLAFARSKRGGGKSLIIIGFRMTLRSFWSSVCKISQSSLRAEGHTRSFEMALVLGVVGSLRFGGPGFVGFFASLRMTL